MAQRRQHVAVVVLGDVGRSPRMQYHATSLAGMKNTHVSWCYAWRWYWGASIIN